MQETSDTGVVIANFKTRAASLFMGLAFLVLDLASKAWAFGQTISNENQTGFRLIQLTQHRNPGISFDFPLPTSLIAIVTLLVLVWALKHWLKARNAAESFALSLIIFGALGNLYDRLSLGFVRDWLLLWNRTAINLADLAILIGVIWFWTKKESQS